MRNSKPTVLHNNQNQIAAIILEGDYCAQHEWGIKPIQAYLQIPRLEFGKEHIPRDYKGPWGMDRIIAKPLEDPDHILLTKIKETKANLGLTDLIFSAHGTPRETPHKLERNKKRYEEDKAKDLDHHKKCYPNSEPQPYTEDRRARWDEAGFQITTTDPELGDFLQQIHAGLLGKPDSHPVTVWIGGSGNNPFGRGGLCLGLPHLIDQEGKDTMVEEEQRIANLHWMAKDTGIPALIPSNKYHALSPSKTLKSRVGNIPIETKHPVMFFLNPREQKDNNYGWFTVEELEAWTRGEGPIPKTEEQKAKP